jgi:outer membrane PBP1 activator LpoA protein
LPLTGFLSGPGGAIYKGFMAAYKKAHSEIELSVYDTNKGAATAIYQQAIDEGADYVIGPLQKNEVAAVAAMPHPVPTLLLNAVSQPSANLYSFGLSPSDEAAEVAKQAAHQGLAHALIIAPDSSWGAEVVQAFRTQWQISGGEVVSQFLYADNSDLNQGVRNLLNIPESENKAKQLRVLLGDSLHTRVSRRQDVDLVFMLAYPSKARQIMPLLKYYYAADLPVYATSISYGGTANALKDKDLDGLIFCDLPWVLTHQMTTKVWPEQWNSYNRLYALGMQSYEVSTSLYQLPPSDGAEEQNGFSLSKDQHIRLTRQWGQFKQGLVQSFAVG